ncbi:hypothetical protein BJ508DRAFT_367137 [Ascobolus immersus RN42]|uniref:Mid2 domain-containing protein n=1 Tax=Ascobolus immersus RN42 TaxID=1160509 RepID=A0A3N4HEJ5_ASCIM|nr:hypothetical protein BJ508DRAFT_367137 [Ascobolus immersus RN42]
MSLIADSLPIAIAGLLLDACEQAKADPIIPTLQTKPLPVCDDLYSLSSEPQPTTSSTKTSTTKTTKTTSTKATSIETSTSKVTTVETPKNTAKPNTTKPAPAIPKPSSSSQASQPTDSPSINPPIPSQTSTTEYESIQSISETPLPNTPTTAQPPDTTSSADPSQGPDIEVETVTASNSVTTIISPPNPDISLADATQASVGPESSAPKIGDQKAPISTLAIALSAAVLGVLMLAVAIGIIVILRRRRRKGVACEKEQAVEIADGTRDLVVKYLASAVVGQIVEVAKTEITEAPDTQAVVRPLVELNVEPPVVLEMGEGCQ